MRGFCRLVAIVALVGLVAAAAAGCKSNAAGTTAAETAAPAGERPLYARLGGGPAIAAVVSDFVSNISTDPRISQFFQDADLPKLQKSLTLLIDQASGGPEKYEGRDMKTIHHGLGISEADFNALIEDLTKSLDKFKVGPVEQNELLGLLAGMKGDIVEK